MPDCIYNENMYDNEIYMTCGFAEDVRWVRCPHCGDIHNLHRLGSIGELTIGHKGRGWEHPGRVITGITHSPFIRCGHCQRVFESELPLLSEMMGAIH